MALFKNLTEFYSLIHFATVGTIDYVSDKILEELNIQMVQKKIGLHNSFYQSTGDFYSAWKADITSRLGEYFQTSIRFDGDSMSLDPDNFVHGSNFYDVDDVRDIMPYIVFGGQSGGLFGDGYWRDNRDAWSPTISRLNKSFNKWIIEGFRANGFSVKADNTITYFIEDID